MTSKYEQIALAVIEGKLSLLLKQWKAIRQGKADDVYRLYLDIINAIRNRQNLYNEPEYLATCVLNLAFLNVNDQPGNKRVRQYYSRQNIDLLIFMNKLLCEFDEQIRSIQYHDVNWANIMDFTLQVNDVLETYRIFNIIGWIDDGQFNGNHRLSDKARKSNGNTEVKGEALDLLYKNYKMFVLDKDVYDADEFVSPRNGERFDKSGLIFHIDPKMPLDDFEEHVNGIRMFLHTQQLAKTAKTQAEIESVLMGCLSHCNFKPKLLQSPKDASKFTRKKVVKIIAGLIYEVNLNSAKRHMTLIPNSPEPVRSHIADQVEDILKKFHLTISRKAIMNGGNDVNEMLKTI